MSYTTLTCDQFPVNNNLENLKAEVKRLEDLERLAKASGFDRQARHWKREALLTRLQIADERSWEKWGLR
jgi:hypothetical protein